MSLILITPTRSDPAHDRVAAELGAAYRKLGRKTICLPERGRAFDRIARRRLQALLDEGRATAVHIQFFSRGLKELAGIRWPTSTRLLLTHQGAGTDLLVEKVLFRRLAARADAVSAVSRSGLRDLRAFLNNAPARLGAVGNGAAAPHLRPRRAAPVPYLLTVSRLAAYKGLDVLALAFARLAAEGSRLNWLACGPDQTGGAFALYLKKLGLTGRVRLLGARPPTEVARLMAGCRMFALPSRRENHPMALLEALAAGKPVVASRVDGVPEILTHGKNGLLVPPGDADALYRALRRLDCESGLRRRLGNSGKFRARDFTWDAAAACYLKLLRE